MSKFSRGFGQSAFQGALYVAAGAFALTVSASGQGYPPQGYPTQGYPGYPPQSYPTQSYPAQSYPAQAYPAQGYPAQSYPAQGYPAAQAAASAPNTPVAASPVCVRLETQLATLNSGAANSPLAAQIQREQDAIAKEQAELDRAQLQARKAGCGQGFFSLFSGFNRQCGPLNSQIDQIRGDLDRMMSDLEQLKSGNNDQQGQRVALIGELAQNNCGAQYTQAARAAGPQGFFEALLGGGTIVTPGGNGAPAGTYRTVCVRSCDGYYFPISYSTVPSRFAADALTCQRLCPGSQVTLYAYQNPGQEIEQAVSVDGAPYTALPNAFRYRKERVSGCFCRPPGETWVQALRNADDSSTLESGDIVVTDKNEKALTRIPQAAPRKPESAAGTPSGDATSVPADATPVPADAGAASQAASTLDNSKIRVVGPSYLPQ
jgi:hypothetical protein